MNKTFEVIGNYPLTGKTVKAYINGASVMELDITDGDVDCAVKILRALGFTLLYMGRQRRISWINGYTPEKKPPHY